MEKAEGKMLKEFELGIWTCKPYRIKDPVELALWL